MSAAWLIPENKLILEQQRAITLSPKRPRVIFGPPGSGKTITLVYRARYLISTYQVPFERCLILAFTNALKDYIVSALEDLNIGGLKVLTFDKWCKNFHKEYIGTPPRNGKFSDPAATREAVCSYLQENKFPKKPYDFILIDEAHDLEQISFEVLTSVSEHITVLIDHKQQIYSSGCTERDILTALGLNKINMALLEAHRCAFNIAHLASEFIKDNEQSKYFLRQSNAIRTSEEPLLLVANNFQQEINELISILKTRMSLGERIAILFPAKWQVEKFPLLVKEHGIEVEGPPKWPPWRNIDYQTYDFSTERPKAMTYHSAKGLTFDTVLMPRLTTGHFRGALSKKANELLFVGITRALTWVYLSTIYDEMISPIKTLYQKKKNNTSNISIALKEIKIGRQMTFDELLKENNSKSNQNFDYIEVDFEGADNDLSDIF